MGKKPRRKRWTYPKRRRQEVVPRVQQIEEQTSRQAVRVPQLQQQSAVEGHGHGEAQGRPQPDLPPPPPPFRPAGGQPAGQGQQVKRQRGRPKKKKPSKPKQPAGYVEIGNPPREDLPKTLSVDSVHQSCPVLEEYHRAEMTYSQLVFGSPQSRDWMDEVDTSKAAPEQVTKCLTAVNAVRIPALLRGIEQVRNCGALDLRTKIRLADEE